MSTNQLRTFQLKPAPLGTAPLQRLTALWALSECGLAGVLHLLKIPLSGIFMAGPAIIILALMARHQASRRQIWQAYLVVMVVKVIVSPHAPPGAYTAMTFQTLATMFFYSVIPSFRAAALVTAVVCLVETSLQRLLLLAFLGQKPLVEAIDAFGEWIVQVAPFLSGIYIFDSLTASLIAVYVSIYFVAGVGVGLLIGRLPSVLNSDPATLPLIGKKIRPAFLKTRRKKRPIYLQKRFYVLLALLVILTWYALTSARGGDVLWLNVLGIVGVAVAAIVAWYGLIAPAIIKLVVRVLKSRKSAYAAQVDYVLSAIPLLRGLVVPVWAHVRATEQKPLRRIFAFLSIYFSLALYADLVEV